MIAALYVDPKGCYAGLPDVEVWDEARDARRYAGPWPVVAHPPCQRWGPQWHGCRPEGHPKRGKRGDDAGCFTMALHAVRTYGGVLEHPANSKAWAAHGLPWPLWVGWHKDLFGGWCCRVEQGNYGHPADKPTWLYAFRTDLPDMEWGQSGKGSITGSIWDGGDGRRSRTPPAFRDLLLSIARSAEKRAA
jgi:hypothetical protein